MDKDKMLNNYARGLGGNERTRLVYLRYPKAYLDYCEGRFDREMVTKFLDHLRAKHNYSDGTVNFIFRNLRTFFSRNKEIIKGIIKDDQEWPFRRGEAPQISEDDIDAPALDPEVVGEMIEAVKQKGNPDERAFLAVSTTYGTRKIEMIWLDEKDVNLKGKTIHITTAKYGRERTHLIPDEILPYLGGYDFNSKISEFGLFSLWYRLEHLVGLDHINHVGFHSIRRTLNTILLDYLSEATVMSFLRWKQRTSSHMPYRYSAQRFVGKEGLTTKVVGEAKDVDTKIFEVHPFIKYWR